METMKLSIKIVHQNKGTFQAKFAKLVRRAEKLGLTAPVAQWGEAEWKTDELGERTLWHNVTVTGQTIGFDGWKLVAAIDLLDAKSGAVIIRSQEESKPEWRNNASRCDHCKAVRNRKMTVVVRHQNGHEMLVGTDCLKDFCPGTSRDPVALAAYFDNFMSIGSDMDDSDDEGFGGGSGSIVIEPSMLLPVVAEITITHGFVSRAKSEITGGETTASTAMRHVYGQVLKGEDRVVASVKAIEIATAALAWAKALQPANEYERNINTLAIANFGEHKHAGFIASIVPAYLRAMDAIKARDNRRAAAAQSRHVGVVGEKLQTKVTLVRRIAIDSMYGTSHLHIFKDEAGNTLKWFCSGALPEFPAEGQYVEIVGTVKSHDMREGAETGMTRVKLFTPKVKKSA